MCKPQQMFVGFLLICLLMPLAIAAAPQASELSRFAPMRNKDVLVLIEKKITPDEVISIIRSSWCNFDTFPPVLQDLKQRGVPGQVLQAMVDAPYGPPANSKLGGAAEQRSEERRVGKEGRSRWWREEEEKTDRKKGECEVRMG